jgi:hypothetical protein
MGRGDAPADVQWARALTAVVVGLVLACGTLRPVVSVPGASKLQHELRSLSAIPCQVLNIVRGVY